MFKNQGSSRTISHDLKIASLLSFVAGIVNVAGFLAINKLTTNVTGHFAFFIEEVYHFNFNESLVYFFYILFFFLGSFVSNLFVEFIGERGAKIRFVIPVILESVILFGMAIYGYVLVNFNHHFLAISLLFAMGLQNSLVTRISNALVRTTHLTGLFTDLGIDLSQLIFSKQIDQIKKLKSTIKLRFRIIIFFFLGGIFGGYFYSKLLLMVLIFPALLLIGGLFYDTLSMKFKKGKIAIT